MLKSLFSSENRIKILNRFLLHPGEEFYLRQLAIELGISPRQVNLELNRFEKIGLLGKRISGKQHYYSANKSHVLFDDLRNIFLKTIGLKNIFITNLHVYEDAIDYSYIYGSFAEGTFTAESDVDLMILGEVNSRKIAGSIRNIGEELKREINVSIFLISEYMAKLKNNDHFIKSVHGRKKLMIMGGEDELERLV